MFFIQPEKEYIYSLLQEYYGSPDLVKIRDDEELSIYGVQLPCLLLNERRFLILLCPRDVVSTGRAKNMKDLRWTSLQSRTLSDEQFAHLPIHNDFRVHRDAKFALPLSIHHRTQKVSSYRTDGYPIDVSLLHQKNNEFEYPNEGTLMSALETYQTIVQWSPPPPKMKK